MWHRRAQQKISEKIFAILKSPWFFFLGALSVFVLIALPLWQNLSERYRITAEIADFEEQINRTQNKNLELQKLIGYLGSDQFVEEQARESLGLKKNGEQVYIVKGLPETQKAVAKNSDSIYQVPGLEKAEERAVVSNPERWLSYFFKHQ